MILAIACMVAGLLGAIGLDNRIAWAVLLVGGLLTAVGVGL